MSRVGNPVSKISRSIGSVASRSAVEAPHASLAPKYAELLRNRRPRIPDAQSDPNLVTFPSHAPNASVERRTPVPILFNPQKAAQQQAPAPARGFSTVTPEVHFVAGDLKNSEPSTARLEQLDVDEVARTAAAA
ncbi:unnamed protein product [Parascedosporium putredinis]|uniref:Uncharacterized protein n=1 Tax=Parascedosporium putredinis TaxID=1442378 RepID=A0A9P1H4N6_9PEZI|nr:unnamed protein product [Parascedosporium putredinis]CAI7995766.1 unnamed protein product [Parascedosporium putredinis]